MKAVAARLPVLVLSIISLTAPCKAAGASPKPLRASELLALVAGSALPENIVHEVTVDGLAFRPDDFYRSLLKTAGADSTVLAALDSAKVAIDQTPEAESGKDLLQHIATAAGLMNAKNYHQAANELTAAAKVSFNSPDCGFVMGQFLRSVEQWEAAAAIYQQVLAADPNYPEAHSKLSFVLYRAGDYDGSLNESHAALQQTPNNAEAHKNAGLALAAERKYEAAIAEYQEALRLQPDYAFVHLDLGLLYTDKLDWNDAISENKKVTILDPTNADAFYNLGYDLDQKGDIDSAIQAYREAERLDPQRYDARQNLGADLMNHGHAAEAVAEFRELVKLYPDAEMGHVSLGMSLFATWDLAGAEKEYEKAMVLDPSDALPHAYLGDVWDTQKKYDAALAEYKKAEQLDPTLVDGYRGAGRTLLEMKDLAGAIKQLGQGENVAPGDANIHDLYGQALLAHGNAAGAVAEFQQSLGLDPQKIPVMLELADALEKKGDWVGAIAEYRKASLTDASMDVRTKVVYANARDPQVEYQSAQARLSNHIAALKAAGKSAEAAQLQAAVRSALASPGLSDQLNGLMQAGFRADQARHFDEAIRDFQQAVDLAEKIQPHDPRLVASLDYLGNNYLGQNSAAAEAAFERELKVAQELFGPQSPNLVPPLQSLARNALMQHEYASAEKLFFQAVDINEKVFGEDSNKVADSLLQATTVYFVQKDYAKAEPYLLRAVNIDEALFPKDSINLELPLTALCSLYDKWGKPAKLDQCDRQILAVAEKQFGENSPLLAPVLDSDAKALRTLGQNDQAAAIEKRAALLRSTTMNPN